MDWHAVFCVYSRLLYILNAKHSNRATKYSFRYSSTRISIGRPKDYQI